MVYPKIPPEEIFLKREELGLNNSVKMLTEIIDADKDNNNRIGAIKYLGLISKEVPNLKTECYDTLENVLISEQGIEIKCEAAKALGKLNYEKALKPLKWVIEQEEDNSLLRIAALKAIKKLRFEDSEISLYIEELGSTYNTVKEFVKDKLLTLDPEKLVSSLLVSLSNEHFSNQHKTEIIKLMGHQLASINIAFEDTSYIKLKYPEIGTGLLRHKKPLLEQITLILKEEDPTLMESVITVLKLLEPDIQEDIIKLLLNDDFIVKKNAIILSGKLRIRDAVNLLIHNLDNIYNEVSIASIEALGEIGDLSAIPELLDVLDIEDISFEYTDLDMKLYIIDAIKRIYLNNEAASFEELYTYIDTDNDTIKESIAFILGEVGKKEFVTPLQKLLKTRNLDVRKNTIIALGKIGEITPLEELTKILEDDDSYWLLKKVAIDAIYKIFQVNWYKIKEKDVELETLFTRYSALLMDHLRQKDEENFKVKLSLIKFLEVYGGEKALDALLKRVNDFHRVVRIHASNAIKKIEEKLEMENTS